MAGVSFEVSADAYGLFMGRFSGPLAAVFADFAGVAAGQTVLDVGCGTGALTDVLVTRLGTGRVRAVDPSQSFVAVMQKRFPGVDVRLGDAEDLPYEDGGFDAALAQLVVHFMADPVAGLTEMARACRPGGVVAANVWDQAGGTGPLAVFWDAARELSPGTPDESTLPGVREGHLQALFTQAGLHDSTATPLTIEVAHASFEDWWRPYTLGVGPAGAHVAALTPPEREELSRRCRALLPDGPFTTRATAWAVRATV